MDQIADDEVKKSLLDSCDVNADKVSLPSARSHVSLLGEGRSRFWTPAWKRHAVQVVFYDIAA